MKIEYIATLCAVTALAGGALCGPDATTSVRHSLATALQPFVDSHTLAGAVALVASRDRILAVETVGYANVAARKPMQKDDLFWIASMSKPMTAAAFMMLVDEGKVHLDDPVEKYLPEFRGQWMIAQQDKSQRLLRHPQHPIRVREILSHTSGLPFSSALEQPTLDLLRLRVAVGSYAMTPLQFEPGSRFSYANAGLNTAGRIIEVVSGVPYQRFIRKRLFDPLGMNDTTFVPSRDQLRRLAKSYRPGPAGKGLEEIPITQLKYPLDDPSRQPMPAGGLFSTAHDVGRFCRMMLNGGVLDGKRLLSEHAVKEMTRKQTGPNVHVGYGLGWSADGDTFGHGGAYSTQMWVDKRHGLVEVLLVQHAGFPGNAGGKINDAFRRAAVKLAGK